jgi:hypothetical protein
MSNPFYPGKKLPIALLHCTAGFLMLNGWYESRIGDYPEALTVFFLVLAILELIYTFFAARWQRTQPRVGGVLRIVAAAAFALYAGMLIKDGQSLFGGFMILVSASFVAIYLIEARWNKPFILRVNEEGVWVPRIFKSELFPWERFNHVILRDNLLTLDFSSNRVVQLDLAGSLDTGLTGAFNMFCREQLYRHGVRPQPS